MQHRDDFNRLGRFVHALKNPVRFVGKAVQLCPVDGFRGKAIGQDFQPVAAVDDFQNVSGGLSGSKVELVLINLRQPSVKLSRKRDPVAIHSVGLGDLLSARALPRWS